jgi:hypothetical protein
LKTWLSLRNGISEKIAESSVSELAGGRLSILKDEKLKSAPVCSVLRRGSEGEHQAPLSSSDEEMDISSHTVQKHLRNLFSELVCSHVTANHSSDQSTTLESQNAANF